MVFKVITNNQKSTEVKSVKDILKSRKEGWSSLDDVDIQLPTDRFERIRTLSQVVMEIMSEIENGAKEEQERRFDSELYYPLQLLVDERAYLEAQDDVMISDNIPEGDFEYMSGVMMPYLTFLTENASMEQIKSVYSTLTELSWCLRGLMMFTFWKG